MRFTRHTEAETFNRKEMVKALGEYLGVRPHYEGMPSRAYTVGAFTVDFEGAIIGDDFTQIREFLISEGYAQPDDFEAPAEASGALSLRIVLPAWGFWGALFSTAST